MYKKPLILGSEGLIGTALKKLFDEKGIEYIPYDIKMGSDYDLTWTESGRQKSNFRLDMHKADFVFFLAYDVGGSKYLEEKQNDFNFISNNIKMMENVFSDLKIYKKPFVFASSMMAEMPHSSYGSLKKIGESYTKSLNGISARFWNVFGKEQYGTKSHLVPDLINNYYNYFKIFKKDPKAFGSMMIKLRTDGTEVRQFISARQAAEALYLLMKNYNDKDYYQTNTIKDKTIFDISSGEWHDINHMAKLTISAAKKCIEQKYDMGDYKMFLQPIISPGKNKDFVQFDTKIEPNLLPITRMGWNPHPHLNKTLFEVAEEMLNDFSKELSEDSDDK